MAALKKVFRPKFRHTPTNDLKSWSNNPQFDTHAEAETYISKLSHSMGSTEYVIEETYVQVHEQT
jgi:hypothetical protein